MRSTSHPRCAPDFRLRDATAEDAACLAAFGARAFRDACGDPQTGDVLLCELT